jgi:hypothetical protein
MGVGRGGYGDRCCLSQPRNFCEMLCLAAENTQPLADFVRPPGAAVYDADQTEFGIAGNGCRVPVRADPAKANQGYRNGGASVCAHRPLSGSMACLWE